MAIDLEALRQRFESLLTDPNFEKDFEEWVEEKEKQKKLISEIMEYDGRDQLYGPTAKLLVDDYLRKQWQETHEKRETAVEWFFKWFNDNPEATYKEYGDAFEQAKRMEEEQLNMARIDGINLANKGYGKSKNK